VVGSVGLSLVVLFVACNRCEACVHGSWFGYRWNACECWLVLATGVTHVSLWPLVTMGSLGVLSCLESRSRC
jgi:cytochrome bd-type quinol oxidase subunit 2